MSTNNTTSALFARSNELSCCSQAVHSSFIVHHPSLSCVIHHSSFVMHHASFMPRPIIESRCCCCCSGTRHRHNAASSRQPAPAALAQVLAGAVDSGALQQGLQQSGHDVSSLQLVSIDGIPHHAPAPCAIVWWVFRFSSRLVHYFSKQFAYARSDHFGGECRWHPAAHPCPCAIVWWGFSSHSDLCIFRKNLPTIQAIILVVNIDGIPHHAPAPAPSFRWVGCEKNSHHSRLHFCTFQEHSPLLEREPCWDWVPRCVGTHPLNVHLSAMRDDGLKAQPFSKTSKKAACRDACTLNS